MKDAIISGFNKFTNGMSKHSPLILSGLAICGFITTVVLAVKATPKALNEIELEKDYRAEETGEMPENIELKPKDIVKITWKNYIPAAITGAATIGCIVGSEAISSRRLGSLANLYSVTTAAFDEYKHKVVEKFGENKHKEIRDEIAKDKIIKNDISDKNPVIITGDGEMLCYDSYSGRYFKSDIEKIRRLENKMNKKLIHDNIVSLNDVYYELGLPNIKVGYDIGWNAHNMIEFAFSSHLKDGEIPVLVIDYVCAPYHDYEKF